MAAMTANEMSLQGYAEMVGRVADDLDSLTHAMALALPADLHLKAMRESLPDTVKQLREAYVGITGDNPWSEQQ